MTIERLTGLNSPDSQGTRTRQLSARARLENVIVPPIVIQPKPLRIRSQPALPDCVGCALGGRIHALTGFDPSDRDLWQEAQRRESGRFDPSDGALLEYAVEGVIIRGAKPYLPGEEFDTSADAAEWTEDLAAHDHRQVAAEHRRIDTYDLEDLFLTLAAGWVVFDGGGVTAKFMGRTSVEANVPAGLDELSGNRDGHAQGIFGYWIGAAFDGEPMGTMLLYAGSWSEDFAGCNVPVLNADGQIERMTWAPGCFWAKAETFAQRWDAHSLRAVAT